MFSSLVLGFPKGRCGELSECHRVPYKNPTLWSWEQQSYPGATLASIDDNNIKKRWCPFMHLEAEVFSPSCPASGWSRSDEQDFPHGPRMFSSSWISPKTSRPMPQTDSWPSPLPPHVGTQALQLELSALVSCASCWWVHSLYCNGHAGV